ncbi:hypothetical protein [Peterkaempfera sp. SMS 1(5)a]|uniref:hypothetical protein n=1 Tax=Peterkaempfera podocarpi TaxID=3232308 RepID=UPI0036710426
MSSPSSSAPPASRFNAGYDTWGLIWSYVHDVLVLNAGLALTTAPLLAALAADRHPWRAPAPFVLLSLLVGPALAGAFGYLERVHAHGQARAADLLVAYRATFRPALARWAVYTLPAWAAGTDAVLLRHTALGLAVSPALAVAALLALGTGVTAMARVAAGERRLARPRRQALLAPAHLLLRRWPLALFNLAVAAVALLAIGRQPLLGLTAVPGCALIVIWRNLGAMHGR